MQLILAVVSSSLYLTSTLPLVSSPLSLSAAKDRRKSSLDSRVAQLQKGLEVESSDANGRNILGYDLPFNAKELLCGFSPLYDLRDQMLLKWTGQLWQPVPLGSFSSTCAVVGSSGVLRNYTHGADIDQSQQVFRFNDAPAGLQGPKRGDYKAMVGVREDVRLVSDLFVDVAKAHPEMLRPDVKYIFHRPIDVPIAGLDDLARAHPTIQFYQVRNPVLKHVGDIFTTLYEHAWWTDWSRTKGGNQWYTPSSGALGMVLALTICSEVKAYGLAATKKGLDAAYHYFDGGKSTDKGNDHAGFFAEKDLWRRLANNSLQELDTTEVAVVPGFASVHKGAPCQSREVITKAGAYDIPVPKSLEEWIAYLGSHA